MRLDLIDVFYALSFALDRVESELLGVDTGHGKRVTYLSLLMGREAGLSENELRDFVGCCLLHDNALVEFIHEELLNSTISKDIANLSRYNVDISKMHRHHSVVGESNIQLLPFSTDIDKIILYHHENANGSGVLGITSKDIPLKSQILHLADIVDISSRLLVMTADEFEDKIRWVKEQTGILFSEEVVELFLKSVSYDSIVYLQKNHTVSFIYDMVSSKFYDYSDKEIHSIADLFARIVDYKSEFTQNHSRGVAAKAEFMAHYYGFSPEKTTRFYFAGAMHDIGKLMVVNDILEKPDKLTPEEFTEMKNHAQASYYILSKIKEIPDIIKWACRHHEKLNGTGYPFGLNGSDLGFEERLLACIDIYQALTEKRPYKDGLSHEKTISIMLDMVSKGELDENIVKDLDSIMFNQ